MEEHFSPLAEWQNPILSLGKRYRYPNGENAMEQMATEEVNKKFFLQLAMLFHSEKELPLEELRAYPIETVIDYLERTHRYYFHSKLPEIEQSLFNLHQTIPESTLLPVLFSFFQWVEKNLRHHIQWEETHLLPYVKKLAQGNKDPDSTILYEFTYQHQDTVEAQLKEVKWHLQPMGESNSEGFPFKVLLMQLEDFEKDLRIHSRIEEEILLPMALELEQNL